ncbi:putative NADPH-quinone reductase [Bifidobacterium commune]|uniref:Putative NADPH-quinone reductase (Modulator of drug activity B) n=1 Tax=Bifidobacterium commune TaxID=1505727 RepID=A0A1C4H2M7_9BIFI|nr:NAD(P)H-dependent oxidoreductase [Bifidobacterium commune]MBB2954807.1 putative NADPH-quinone reductase [Bifidobacterium commune]SCC78828.1 Putative NADPH-quinone reductase (modulator of drug activity B) [Bifidobacterium commune]
MGNYGVVYCHPYEKSFNHAILGRVLEALENQGHSTRLIDLYAEGFNPVYDKEELRLFHTGGTHDPLTEKYLDMVRSADSIVFVTPIWWNSVPGMLKGFIDKVMKEGEGLSHTVTSTGIHGELGNIRHTYVFTTSTSPTIWLRLMAGNGVKRVFIDSTLKQLGMKGRRWVNFGGITGSTPKRRHRYLDKVSKIRFK